jgi:hypothetical protein
MQGAAPLFEQLLTDAFAELPRELRRVHDARPYKRLSGRCTVERGQNWIARLLASIASLPPTATDIPLTVTIKSRADNERWTRNFDGHVMESRLWKKADYLAEQLGPITLLFSLSGKNQCIEWRVVGARFVGVPIPARWFSNSRATERLMEGRYSFDVSAVLPLAGLLVRYVGWLTDE